MTKQDPSLKQNTSIQAQHNYTFINVRSHNSIEALILNGSFMRKDSHFSSVVTSRKHSPTVVRKLHLHSYKLEIVAY